MITGMEHHLMDGPETTVNKKRDGAIEVLKWVEDLKDGGIDVTNMLDMPKLRADAGIMDSIMHSMRPVPPRPWMQYGATVYELGSTSPGKITIVDVANSLARINRFTGHSKTYSVARHSVFVSKLLDLDRLPALYGLAHDVHETVINDISSPVKAALGPVARIEFDELEEAADRALFQIFGLAWPMPPEIKKLVKRADMIALATEHRDLQPPCEREWTMLTEAAHHSRVSPTSSEREDAHNFLSRFDALTKGTSAERSVSYGTA